MRLRVATPDDADALAAIAWAAKASWGYAPAQLEAWRDQLAPDVASLGSEPTCVAEVDGEPAGFCQLDTSTEPVELSHLWVHPRFMRQGVGRALLDAAARHLAALGVDSLHIDSDPNAETFYLRCGARRVGAEAAPIEGQPGRVRPQLLLPIVRPQRASS